MTLAARQIARLLTVAVVGLAVAGCTGKSPDQLVASAKEYIAKNDVNAAVIQLKNALQAAPDNGEARLLLGTLLVRQRDFASAEKELRRALELSQPPDEVLPPLAQAMVQLGEFDKLVKEFGARKLSGGDAQAAFRTKVGDANLRLGRTQEAAAAYSEALAAQPAYPAARLGQAVIAAAGGDTAEAMKIADEVIAASPRMAEAHTLKAELLLAGGDRAGAAKSLEKAIEVDGAYMPARRLLVQMLIEDKAFDRAAAQIDAGRKAAGTDLSLLHLQGLLAFEKGDIQQARSSTAEVLKYASNHVPTLVLAGAAEFASKQFATGEAHLRKALALAPDHQGARRLLVGAYLRHGEPARAREALQPLLTAEAGKDPRNMLLAGETYLANGDVKQASAYFASASAGGFKSVAQTRLGQVALASGNWDEGIRQLESAAQDESGGDQAELSLIAAHLQRKEFDKAMAAARALEKRQPDNPRSHFMLGTVSVARKDLPAARKNFDMALELQPTYLPAVGALANLDLQDKKPEDARARFEAVIKRDPKNEQAYLSLAQLQARTGGKPDQVAATLQRAVAANPQAVGPRVALVTLHLQARDSKAALAAAKEAAAAIPNEPRVLGALALAQEGAGDLDGAIETLTKLAAAHPASPQPLQQLAALYTRKRDFNAAVDALRRAQRAAPEDRGVRAGLVAAYARAGKFDEALREAKEVQSREPKSAQGHALEGQVYAAQKRWAEAERAFRAALNLDPRDGAVAAQLHGVLVAAGKAGEADPFARKWLADHPKDVRMRLYLADRALAAKNNKAAFGLYQEVVAIEPNNVVALNNLAYVAGELGDARALGWAERAVKLAPLSPAALDTLGMLLVNKGDTTKGLQYLEQARAIAPDAPVLRLNFAIALAKAGRKDEARKELEALRERQDVLPEKERIDGLLKAL